jgi:predicted phage replisome organizer
MAEVKWIRIDTDIFNDEKISIIEGTMPESDADSIIIIWFKLLCLAGRQNNDGVFKLNNEMPFTEEMFSAIFRRPVASVKKAISVFESLGMVEVIDNCVIIPNWEKHQSIDKLAEMREKNRQRVQKHRDKQKELAECNVTETLQLHYSNAVDVDKDIDIDCKCKDDDVKQSNNIIENKNNKVSTYSNIIITEEELNKLKSELNDFCEGIPSWKWYLGYMNKQGQDRNKKYTYSDIVGWYRQDKQKGWRAFTTPSSSSYDMDAWKKKSIEEVPKYERKKK